MGSPLKTRQGEGNGPVAGSSNNPFISPETRAGSAKPQQRGEEAGRGEDDPWQGRGPTGGNGDEETPGSAPGDIYGNPFDSAGRGGAPVRDGVSLSVDAEAEPSIAETGGSGEGGSQVALGGREGNGGDAAAVSDFGAGVGGGGDGEREGVGEDRARMLKSKPSVIALKHSVIVTASGEVYVGEVRAGFMDGHG